MSRSNAGLPYHQNNDLEAGTMDLSVPRISRWKQAALVLNASRRFRYILSLKRRGERKQRSRKIRAHSQVIRAAYNFKKAGEQVTGTVPPTAADFTIKKEELASLTRNRDVVALADRYKGTNGLARILKTNLDKGIDGDDADLSKRKKAFGSNTYTLGKRRFWTFLWEAWQDSTLIILMIVAVASSVLGVKAEGMKEGCREGVSVAIAVVINLMIIGVTAISDHRQHLQFRNTSEKKINIRLKVIRGGKHVNISTYDIVVGDVVPLCTGDQVPADGILITGHSLAIDKSSITGESKIFPKDSEKPFLLSGSKVAGGSGTMLVTSVGKYTELGLLLGRISKENGKKQPLQVRLNGVATFIIVLGTNAGLLVAYALLARYFTGHNTDGSPKPGDVNVEVIKIFITALTIVVAAVPEGLPLAVYITRFSWTKKIRGDKALVRRPFSCETTAYVNNLVCDKAGITLNKMTVVEAYAGGKKIDCSENMPCLSPMLSSLLFEGIAQNKSVPESCGVDVSGSPTEKAILHWGTKLGMDFEDIRFQSSVLQVVPFNSEKKRGGVALQLPNSQVHIHWKGAAETVLASCTKYIDDNDQLVAMEGDKLLFFKKSIENTVAGGLRCVAIAWRSYELEVSIHHEERAQWQLPEDNLVLLAIVGIWDHCQPGVKEAVEQCQSAGIKVRMFAHENLRTAKQIALECGILDSDATDESNLIEGKEFRELPDRERQERAQRIKVMARSSTYDKRLFVQALSKSGDVVAVTGFVTNDALALHEADIGLAMGIQGTEVAKESSDIIILDDSFATVVKALRWGRFVHANVRKFMQLQLTVNVVAVTINCMAAILYGDVPLKAVQLLWVNLFIVALGPLALANEHPADHLMQELPIERRQPYQNYVQGKILVFQVVYQIASLIVINFRGGSLLLKNYPSDLATKVKNTMMFNAFVICQISVVLHARKTGILSSPLKWVTSNSLFLVIAGTILVIQFIIIQFLGKIFFTVRLSWAQWQYCFSLGLVELAFAVIIFSKNFAQRHL